MREFMKLFEDEERIRRRGYDQRDMEQKLLDVINHPSTEPFLKAVTQRKLDKLRAERLAAEQKAASDRLLPALDVQVNYGSGSHLKPLPPEEWDRVFVGYGQKRILTFRQIIERVLPLRPFRIDFDPTGWMWATSYHTDLWFHPEDEPESGQFITKVINSPTKIHGGVADGDGHYLRGGTSRYTIWWDRDYYSYGAKKKR